MTLQEETQALRERLRQWAAAPEWKLLVRYELLPQHPSPVWHKRLPQQAGRLLRVLGLSRRRYRNQPWQSGLKHVEAMGKSKTLLVWSAVSSVEAQREACGGLQRLLAEFSDLSPVLVTELADFSFYSRLGWLVEYLPNIPGDDPSYSERKKHYLAWRYRDAFAVPLSAGVASSEEFKTLIMQGQPL